MISLTRLALPLGCLTVLIMSSLGCRENAGAASGGQTVAAEARVVREAITAAGVVKPQVGAEVKVGPRISGVLKRLYVKVGDQVAKGDLLAEVERDDLSTFLEVARAEREMAAARQERAVAVLERRRLLSQQGLISAEEYEGARLDVEIADRALRAAEARLREATVSAGFTTVRAPLSGTVTAIATQEGETVAASFAVPTFVQIVNLSRLHVEAYVDEIDMGRLAVGMPATVQVDALPGSELRGSVEAITPQATLRNGVVTYVAVVRLTPPAGGEAPLRLLPEMNALVRIETGNEKTEIVIPRAAIRKADDGADYVLVQVGERRERRDVVTRGGESEEAVVELGLQTGELVVVGGEE
jgi:macrolide-specific efflux system membrane fusion protein